MSVRMAVYYRTPDDPEMFEKGYIAEHMPITEGWKGMRSRSFNKVKTTVAGEFPYAYAFVGTWDDFGSWQEDIQGDVGKAAVADAQQRAPQGFDVVVFEEIA